MNDVERYPRKPSGRPEGVLAVSRYRLRFAKNSSDLREVQRLRYRIFNIECGLGLDISGGTMSDKDGYDERAHHLIVEHLPSGTLVGTYRLITRDLLMEGERYYSHADFDLEGLEGTVLTAGAEISRACIAPEHRNGRVLWMLWKGLARYLQHNELHYLFGCCSLPTLDEAIGWSTYRHLLANQHMHAEIVVHPVASRRCEQKSPSEGEEFDVPPLFASYLRMGAKVCSAPSKDVAFKALSFFVVLDADDIEESTHQKLFSRIGWDL